MLETAHTVTHTEMAEAIGPGPRARTDPAAEMAVEVDPTGRFLRTNELLGKGASKTVYKGFDRIEGTEVAWNQASLMGCDLHSAHQLLHTEVAVLKKLRHRNIMKFIASWVDDEQGTLNFITEYFHSGCLKRHRLSHRFISPQLLKRWTWQILQGLVYLHGHNPPIIHRDLKCDNIFIHGVSGEVKIGDLGLARLMEENLDLCSTCLGTPEFMAPEMYKEAYNEKVDIYAFGMCLLEMVTMSYPYSECKSACQIYRNVIEGIPPQSLHRVSDAETRRFIELCICPDPAQRPSARQLVKHKFFDSLNKQMKEHGTDSPVPPDSSLEDEDSALEDTVDDLDSMYEESNMDTAFGMGPNRRSSHTKLDLESLIEACRKATEANNEGEGSGNVCTDSTVETASEWEDLGEEASAFKDKTNFCIQYREAGSLPFTDVVYFDLVVAGRKEPKRLMFSFDMESDTVEAVGLELEEEFSLTQEEREQFTDVLRHELERVLLRMPEDKGQGFEAFVESTFGSVVVSMSLDDWKGFTRSSVTLASQHLDPSKKKEIALKIKLEKKGGDKRSTEGGSADPTEANEVPMSSQTSFERPTKSLSRVSFDRPGKAWENLLRHFQKGGPVSVEAPDDSSIPRAGVARNGQQDRSPEGLVFRTDTANVNALEETLAQKAQRASLKSPKTARRMLIKAVTPRSASQVLHQVKAAAGAMRQMQSAALFLCRNSLDAKKVAENKQQSQQSQQSMKKTNSKRNIFGRQKPDSSKPVDTKSVHDFRSLEAAYGPTHEMRTFSEGQYPMSHKHGQSVWGQLKRAVQKAPWSLRRRRSKNLRF